MASCKACGVELRQGARFCDMCGAKVEKICPSCGEVLREQAKFCDLCGVKLPTQQIVVVKRTAQGGRGCRTAPHGGAEGRRHRGGRG